MTTDILDRLEAALAAELAAPRCADGAAITRRRAVLRDAAAEIRTLKMKLDIASRRMSAAESVLEVVSEAIATRRRDGIP